MDWSEEFKDLRNKGRDLFSAQQWSTIDRMLGMVVMRLKREHDGKLAQLRSEIKDLRDDKAGSSNDIDGRDVFFVSDIADLLGVKPDTVNKNYIRTGLVETNGKVGCRSTISKDEFLRCRGDYVRFGAIKPKGIK